MRLSLLNAHSVCNKGAVIHDLIEENELDMLALTETWINDNNEQRTIASLLPHGYSIITANREKRVGGGVAFIHRTSLKCKHLKQRKASSFECLQVMVTIRNRTFQLCIIYRPPVTGSNGITMAQFQSEFADFFTQLMCTAGSVVVMGDFNVHCDEPSQ